MGSTPDERLALPAGVCDYVAALLCMAQVPYVAVEEDARVMTLTAVGIAGSTVAVLMAAAALACFYIGAGYLMGWDKHV